MVFSKSHCPFSVMAKELFESAGVDFKAVELDQEPDGKSMQASLKELTQQGTVPNIFIGGKHLGGFDTTQAAKNSGNLKTMLDEAGVSHHL